MKNTHKVPVVKPKLDTDVWVLQQCVKALNKSTSPKMLKANLGFLYDRYILNPPGIDALCGG